MKQMLAPQAPAKEEGCFYEITKCVFFRRKTGNGEIYFAWNRAGGVVYHFPVLEDGSVSNGGPQNIFEGEIICAIHPHDLGIKEFRWTDEKPSE